MAKDRKFVAYRRLERPYTRKSKYRKYMYVRGRPHNKLNRYVMGNRTRTFPVSVRLVSKTGLQIRHSALEAGRMAANRRMETRLGRSNFYMRIHTFPHHVLRENALASGAGADRLSTGMKKSFGKPVGVAAQIPKGKIIFEIGVEEKNVQLAKDALRLVRNKLPNDYYIQVENQPTGSNEKVNTKLNL
ncbi:MAG: 50S ribosomal protein L16 [Candidatus Woesearchaeota archaeon]